MFAIRNDEITLTAGTVVTVLEKYEDGWWRIEINGNCGLYPSNYLEDINQVCGLLTWFELGF